MSAELSDRRHGGNKTVERRVSASDVPTSPMQILYVHFCIRFEAYGRPLLLPSDASDGDLRGRYERCVEVDLGDLLHVVLDRLRDAPHAALFGAETIVAGPAAVRLGAGGATTGVVLRGGNRGGITVGVGVHSDCTSHGAGEDGTDRDVDGGGGRARNAEEKSEKHDFVSVTPWRSAGKATH